MRKGTTPTHVFELPFDVSVIKKVKILYSQNFKVIVCKKETDCQMSGNTVTTELTQEETLKFNQNMPLDIQMRILTMNDKALLSDTYRTTVCCCYDREVLI